MLGLGHHDGKHGEGQQPDGQVHEEYPSPGEVVREPAAHGRADDRSKAEHAAHQALVTPALARREQVADDGHAVRHHRAAAQTLDATEHDELEHLVRGPRQRREDAVQIGRSGRTAEHRTHEEHRDAAEIEVLAAVQVGELPHDGDGDGGRERVDDEHPGQVLHAAQLAHDAGHRRADDGGVERAEQHRQQDAGEDVHLAALGQVSHVHAAGSPTRAAGAGGWWSAIVRMRLRSC